MASPRVGFNMAPANSTAFDQEASAGKGAVDDTGIQSPADR